MYSSGLRLMEAIPSPGERPGFTRQYIIVRDGKV
jgi:hypothetical protein